MLALCEVRNSPGRLVCPKNLEPRERESPQTVAQILICFVENYFNYRISSPIIITSKYDSAIIYTLAGMPRLLLDFPN